MQKRIGQPIPAFDDRMPHLRSTGTFFPAVDGYSEGAEVLLHFRPDNLDVRI
jgi:hypothetical protein